MIVPIRKDKDPDHCLDIAKGKLDDLIVIGVDKEGYEYFDSTIDDAAAMLWLLERCKHILMTDD